LLPPLRLLLPPLLLVLFAEEQEPAVENGKNPNSEGGGLVVSDDEENDEEEDDKEVGEEKDDSVALKSGFPFLFPRAPRFKLDLRLKLRSPCPTAANEEGYDAFCIVFSSLELPSIPRLHRLEDGWWDSWRFDLLPVYLSASNAASAADNDEEANDDENNEVEKEEDEDEE
jgi:hypothetical protein